MKWTNKGHEFDDIGYLLKDKKQVFIYGAGDIGIEIFNLLKKLDKWIEWDIYLVDRNENKQKAGYKGNTVLSPEQFFDMCKPLNEEEYFVIIAVSDNWYEDVYKNIKKNLSEDLMCFKGSYFLFKYLSIYFIYIHNIVFFYSESMLVSSVCNLNCRDCLNFNPYIKEHYNPTLEELKLDIDIFFNAVDLIGRFQITGGEPLLSKNLMPVLEHVSRNYSDKIISFELVTNGTIMPSDELCMFLSQNNIYVYLDDYRSAVPEKEERYYAVYGKLKKFKVNFHDNYADKWMRMYIPQREVKHLSEDDKIKKFKKCSAPYSTLQNKKISSCNYNMYADRAGLCKADESDYYDLSDYDKTKQKELVEFRIGCVKKGYNEFCEKCLGWGQANDNWCEPAIQMSREKINEMDK